MIIESVLLLFVFIVLNARWVTRVAAVNMELSFGSDAKAVWFSVVAVAPRPISLFRGVSMDMVPSIVIFIADFYKSLLEKLRWSRVLQWNS